MWINDRIHTSKTEAEGKYYPRMRTGMRCVHREGNEGLFAIIRNTGKHTIQLLSGVQKKVSHMYLAKCYSAIKKNPAMAFSRKMEGIEGIIIFRKIRQSPKEKYSVFSCMWTLDLGVWEEQRET